jgi:hypothetical protein
MQVMHALVGCQKRWTNSLTRRFQSLDIVYSPSMLVSSRTIFHYGSRSRIPDAKPQAVCATQKH